MCNTGKYSVQTIKDNCISWHFYIESRNTLSSEPVKVAMYFAWDKGYDYWIKASYVSLMFLVTLLKHSRVTRIASREINETYLALIQ